MPKPVNKLSVLKPSSEIATSARVKLMKIRKHIQKLNDEELDKIVARALRVTEELETEVKRYLHKEVHNANTKT